MIPKVQLTRPIIVRCIWALMAAVHAPALFGVWHAYINSGFAPDRLAGCVALTLTTVFFALKFVDVRTLRLRPGRRSWIAMTLVVALIHVDAVRPEGVNAFITETAVVLATSSIALSLPRLPRLFRAANVGRVSLATQRCSSLRPAGAVWLDENRPHCTVLANRLFLLRAPPV